MMMIRCTSQRVLRKTSEISHLCRFWALILGLRFPHSDEKATCTIWRRALVGWDSGTPEPWGLPLLGIIIGRKRVRRCSEQYQLNDEWWYNKHICTTRQVTGTLKQSGHRKVGGICRSTEKAKYWKERTREKRKAWKNRWLLLRVDKMRPSESNKKKWN